VVLEKSALKPNARLGTFEAVFAPPPVPQRVCAREAMGTRDRTVIAAAKMSRMESDLWKPVFIRISFEEEDLQSAWKSLLGRKNKTGCPTNKHALWADIHNFALFRSFAC
jgi:hypothetical protein